MRRAPGWKGAPEWYVAKILRCHFLWDVAGESCLNLWRINSQTELQTGPPNGCHCQWLKDYPGDSGHSLVDSGTVAENSESCLACVCSVATYGVHQYWEPGPQYVAKGTHPSIPNDYAATCHKVLNALRSLHGRPHGDRLLQLLNCLLKLFSWTD